MFKITVFGAGSFGTAMAHLLTNHGHDVLIWARNEDCVREINEEQKNSRYLPQATLAKIPATTEIKKATKGRNLFISAIPCQHIRKFLEDHKKDFPDNALFVNLAKGIEINTFQTPSEIFKDVLGEKRTSAFATISGPTFAHEVFLNMPTGAVVASSSLATAQLVQKTLSTPHFRLYHSTDLVGVELGGALKNVMAIGVGIVEGLGFGANARAGLITRCLNEMTELGMALGANARTFSGLSGLGDLILTCTGDLSRNRQVGLRLGRGETIATITKSLTHVVEGIPTAKSVYQIAQKRSIDMPNTKQVYRILYENIPPKQAVQELLARELKSEFEI